MDHASLDKFVTRAQQTKRVGFGDLRRLKRALQADSIVTREQVEVLLSVDRDVTRSDPDWTCGSEAGEVSIIMVTWPPMMSFSAGALPL